MAIRLEFVGTVLLSTAAILIVWDRSADKAGLVGFAMSYGLTVTSV
jgi:hypothetical protein